MTMATEGSILLYRFNRIQASEVLILLRDKFMDDPGQTHSITSIVNKSPANSRLAADLCIGIGRKDLHRYRSCPFILQPGLSEDVSS